MADNARGTHVSPGVYSREIDLTYAVKSLGITTLGVAGETMRGPAFQPIHIENWRQFVETFGGTNPEKYKGSQYPKYELPYIAKSYLIVLLLFRVGFRISHHHIPRENIR